MKKKVIVAIADGLGDRPIPAFDGLTPLQYAKTPHLDQLATEGMTGIMDPIAPGITVGTDMGHLILFGNPPQHYPGRGPLEAAGVGMDLEPGDVAFRCNFSTRDDQGIVVDRRAGRIRARKLLRPPVCSTTTCRLFTHYSRTMKSTKSGASKAYCQPIPSLPAVPASSLILTR